MVAQRYSLRLAPGCRVGLQPMVTLQPSRPPLVYLETRRASSERLNEPVAAEVAAEPAAG